MKSYCLFVEEVDNMDIIIAEFKKKFEEFQLLGNSVALVGYPVDFEYIEFVSRMKEIADIPFIGESTIAVMNSEKGYATTGISICVLTADDVDFKVGITGDLDKGNYQEEVQKLCSRLSGDDDKLIFIFCSKPFGVPGDDVITAIEKVSSNVPIYGASASDHFNFEEQSVACEYEKDIHRVALIYMSGNLKPKFINESSIYSKADFAYEVTDSKGDIVNKVGDLTFVEALKNAGFEHEKTGVIMEYIVSPFVVYLKQEDGLTIPVSRNLTYLYHEKGSAAFLGGVPEGSKIEIGLIGVNDIDKSVKNAFTTMKDMISENTTDYKYSICFCTSCAARYLVLLAKPTIESDAYFDIMPKDINMAGLYSFGEFSPVISEKGKVYNIFHNATFGILAL